MYRNYLAAFLLSAVLVGTPCISSVVYAHDQGDEKQGYAQEEHPKHFTEAQSQTLHEAMKKVHEDSKATLADLRDLHKKLHDVLQAKTFDRDAFLSIHKQITDKQNELSEKRTEAFASIAGQFTPKEREHLFWGLAHHHQRYHHHGHYGDRGHHGRFHHGHHKGHHRHYRHGKHHHWGHHRHHGHHHYGHHHWGHKKDVHAWQGHDHGNVQGDNATDGNARNGALLDSHQAIQTNIQTNLQNSQDDYPPYAHR